MAGPDPIAVTNGQGAPRRGRKLSVVVPGLNEERSIPALVERLQPVLDGLGLEWEVIFVDDGSSDGTLALLKGAARPGPPLQGALAQPQLRQGDCRSGRAHLRDGRCGRADGCGPAASPGAHQGIRRALERRLRHRLWPADATATPTVCCIACRRACSTPPSRSSAARRCPRAPGISACWIARRSMP